MARLTKEKKVELLVDAVLPILKLSEWNISVEFAKIPGHRADCEASPEYKEAVVRFDVRNIHDSDLVSFVVHEMLHTIIWRLAHAAESLTEDEAKLEWIRIEEEYLTTQLEQILVPLIEDQLMSVIQHTEPKKEVIPKRKKRK